MLGIENVQRNIPIWSKINPEGDRAAGKAQMPPAKPSKPATSVPSVLFTAVPSTPSTAGGLAAKPPASSPSDFRAAAKDALLSQSTFHLMEVSRAFGLNCSADDKREALAEKILDTLGADTVLAEFNVTSLVTPGGSSSMGPATPGPTAPLPPVAATDPAPDARPGMECTICLEPMGPGARDIGVGKCGHTACFECLTEAVQEQRRCPVCRRDMNVEDIIKLYV